MVLWVLHYNTSFVGARATPCQKTHTLVCTFGCRDKTDEKKSLTLPCRFIYRPTAIMVRMFVNGPGDQGSIPGWVIMKTQEMVLDTSLLNTQHYKVQIKGQWSNPRKGVPPSPTSWCSNYGWPNYIYIYIILINDYKTKECRYSNFQVYLKLENYKQIDNLFLLLQMKHQHPEQENTQNMQQGKSYHF